MTRWLRPALVMVKKYLALGVIGNGAKRLHTMKHPRDIAPRVISLDQQITLGVRCLPVPVLSRLALALLGRFLPRLPGRAAPALFQKRGIPMLTLLVIGTTCTVAVVFVAGACIICFLAGEI